MVNILISFPDYAMKCLNILIDNGFEAFFVGGCVRDGLLGKKSDDIDITTNATPTEIMSLFSHTIPTGVKHGTVTVLIDDYPIEVTTYRQEFGYEDSRHPDSVKFVSSINEDLARRDFTINALACSDDGKIIDLFSGLKDLDNKLIRAVGNPQKRFNEDSLRIVRAYRFSAVLGFNIDENTRKSALILSENISKISGERVLKELEKAVCGVLPAALCELVDSSAFISFGITRTSYFDTVFNRISNLDLTEEEKLTLFISLCQHNTELLASKLKISKTMQGLINALDSLSLSGIPNNKVQIKYLLYKYNLNNIKLYFNFLKITDKVTDNRLFDLLNDIIDSKEVYRISQLNINGNDLINLGFYGENIGTALEQILFAVIEGNLKNTKESIQDFLKN